jgi:biotin-dependent carboxylase-like uncharacterized protein
VSAITILNASVHALVQDLGRFDYQDIGVSTSGALDEHAYLWAQKLLHNDPKNSNALEISYGGLELQSDVATVVAFCGVFAEVFINDKPVPIWQTYPLEKGDKIKVGKFTKGEKLYIAFKGGFALERIYGSYSVSVKERIGTMLQTGQKLPIKEAHHPHHHVCVPYAYIPRYPQKTTLRVLLNYKYFEDVQIEKFLKSEFTITDERDRMGARLEVEDPIISSDKGIVSEPTAYGTLQVPPNGKPIVLLKERQTIGGYPYIGQIFTLDCFLFSQMRRGSKISFEPMSLEIAQKELREFYWFFFEA